MPRVAPIPTQLQRNRKRRAHELARARSSRALRKAELLHHLHLQSAVAPDLCPSSAALGCGVARGAVWRPYHSGRCVGWPAASCGRITRSCNSMKGTRRGQRTCAICCRPSAWLQACGAPRSCSWPHTSSPTTGTHPASRQCLLSSSLSRLDRMHIANSIVSSASCQQHLVNNITTTVSCRQRNKPQGSSQQCSGANSAQVPEQPELDGRPRSTAGQAHAAAVRANPFVKSLAAETPLQCRGPFG